MRFTSPSTGLPQACATRVSRCAIWVAGALLAAQVHALPTDFNDKVESALLCRSDWSTTFWHEYFNKHLQASIRDWGEARWWNSQGAQLGGAATLEVFTNIDESRALMIGALITQPVESTKQQIERTLGVTFRPINTADGVRYITDTMSVLVGTTNQQTKWYCARWNMGNRERIVPQAPGSFTPQNLPPPALTPPAVQGRP
ncbi:hypothetical protein [Chitinimonas sp. BJYL2]|uniref:hypothetical protein n=1 Tax=Chitinimonas sp. BJYL2 TaxID=2976696 RepID=UPI0022B3F897|nr:hypothetical protein [Chitinimonas sp. BJYL2]